MIISYSNIIIILLSAILLSGCNNDLFIKDENIETETSATVAGDGGSVSFPISKKNLKRISVDWYSSSSTGPVYYNRSGEEISSESPASEVARIAYENELLQFEIEISKDEVTFTSIENCIRNELNETIRLEYDYTVRFIHVKILPGKPVELVSVEYNDDIAVNNSAFTRAFNISFTNNSSLNQVYNASPYRNMYAYLRVTTEPNYMGYQDVTMPVLLYGAEGWQLEETEIKISDNNVFYPFNHDVSEEISIPPHTKMIIATQVTYASATKTGTMIMKNPVSGKLHPVVFTCESQSPVNYEIITETAE